MAWPGTTSGGGMAAPACESGTHFRRVMFDDFGINAGYVEELRTRWMESPLSVEEGWRRFFEHAKDVPERATLRQIVDHLSETYCSSIGVEFTQIEDPEPRQWLQQQMESTRNHALARSHRAPPHPDEADRRGDLRAVHPQELRRRQALLARGRREHDPDARSARRGGGQLRRRGDRHRHGPPRAAQRAREHLGKNVREIFAAVRRQEPRAFLGGGDVKYHLGYSSDVVTTAGERAPVDGLQPEPPRVREPRRRGARAREASTAQARRA
jgi:hypothetical protein